MGSLVSYLINKVGSLISSLKHVRKWEEGERGAHPLGGLSYYYLRRRGPGPPFPTDHRQAGERGAINKVGSLISSLKHVRKWEEGEGGAHPLGGLS